MRLGLGLRLVQLLLELDDFGLVQFDAAFELAPLGLVSLQAGLERFEMFAVGGTVLREGVEALGEFEQVRREAGKRLVEILQTD